MDEREPINTEPILNEPLVFTVPAAEVTTEDLRPASMIPVSRRTGLPKTVISPLGVELILPEHLSPSSIKQWNEDKVEYYRQYLSMRPPQRPPQTKPMSVGSAFDAFIKAHLEHILMGWIEEDRRTMYFESQVEKQNRVWAWPAGQYCFDTYIKLGALKSLLNSLKNMKSCKFEFGTTNGMSYMDNSGECQTVPMFGKPDALFVFDSFYSIHDWKVNGFCSKASPKPRYCNILGDKKGEKAHKDIANVSSIEGMPYVPGLCLSTCAEEWALQEVCYKWMMGLDGKVVYSIDQLACNRRTEESLPEIRVAQFRSEVSNEYEQKLSVLVIEIWETIRSGWIFRNMSQEESLLIQKTLNQPQGDIETTIADLGSALTADERW